MGIPNPYRAEVVLRCIDYTKDNDYFHARLTSEDKCPPINIDYDALCLLYVYYSGEISHTEIQRRYKAAK